MLTSEYIRVPTIMNFQELILQSQANHHFSENFYKPILHVIQLAKWVTASCVVSLFYDWHVSTFLQSSYNNLLSEPSMTWQIAVINLQLDHKLSYNT